MRLFALRGLARLLIAVAAVALLLGVPAFAARQASSAGSDHLALLKTAIGSMQKQEAAALLACQEAFLNRDPARIETSRFGGSIVLRPLTGAFISRGHTKFALGDLETDYEALSASDRAGPLAYLHEIAKLINRAVKADNAMNETGIKLKAALTHKDLGAARTDLSVIETIEAGAKRQKNAALADVEKLPEPPTVAVTETVTVAANANIFGAGSTTPPQPGGGGGGSLPPVVNVPARALFVTFSHVTGSVTCGRGCSFSGPAGGTNFSSDVTAYGSISGVSVSGKEMFLVGVFLGDALPATAPPTDTLTPAPDLGQVFYIGDGVNGITGEPRTFVIPSGATRLFLGFADANGFQNPPGYYADNKGSLQATAQIAR